MQKIKNLGTWISGQWAALPASRKRLALIAGLVAFGLIGVLGVVTVIVTSTDSAENYGPPVTAIETDTPENDDGVYEATPPPAPAPVAPPTKVAEQQPPAPAPVAPAPTPNDGAAPRVVTKVRPTDVTVVGSSTPGRTTYRFENGYLIIESDVEELNIEADGSNRESNDTVVTGHVGQPQEIRIEGGAPATLRYRSGEDLTVETDGRNLSIR